MEEVVDPKQNLCNYAVISDPAVLSLDYRFVFFRPTSQRLQYTEYTVHKMDKAGIGVSSGDEL